MAWSSLILGPYNVSIPSSTVFPEPGGGRRCDIEVPLWLHVTQTLLCTLTNRWVSAWIHGTEALLWTDLYKAKETIDVNKEGWGGKLNKLRKPSGIPLSQAGDYGNVPGWSWFYSQEPLQALDLPSLGEEAGRSLNSDTMCPWGGTTGCSQVWRVGMEINPALSRGSGAQKKSRKTDASVHPRFWHFYSIKCQSMVLSKDSKCGLKLSLIVCFSKNIIDVKLCPFQWNRSVGTWSHW